MSDDKFIDFSNFNKELKISDNIDNEDNIEEIKILKNKNENNKHFIINIVNVINTYSQLIELCLNKETNQTSEEINSKIKLYSIEIKNNSKYLSKILKNITINEKK